MNKESQLKLLIIGDTNDADYVTKETDITWEEWEKLFPLFREVIEKRWESTWNMQDRGLIGIEYNWVRDHFDNITFEEMYGEEWVRDVLPQIQDYIPYGEFGVHSIVHIEIREVVQGFVWTDYINPKEIFHVD